LPVYSLIPTIDFDVGLVIETEGTLESFKAVTAEVLLLGGSKFAAYPRFVALDGLAKILPRAERVQFRGRDHLGPENNGDPVRVAAELRRFFA
jgi:hypothetical protein